MGNWQIGNIELSVERGNLIDEPADAIAVGVSTDWTPEGPATGAILKSGGDSLVESIQDQEPGKPGECLILNGGSLASDSVILCALQDRTEAKEPDRFLRQCLEDILKKADANTTTTLGLQPLGASDFGYGLDRTTRSIVESIEKLTEECSSLSTVTLVVYDAVEFNAVDNFAGETLQGESSDPGSGPADFT